MSKDFRRASSDATAISNQPSRMSAARINIKNIDYFKYRKLVVDGNRDDYNACSKEVKALCDNVQVYTSQ